jgi:potassium efflux system protein
LTKEAVLKTAASPEMVFRISSIIRIINSTEKNLKTKQEKVLGMENDLTDILLVIEDSRMKVDKIKEEVDSQIFTKDCPAIWNTADSTLPLRTVSAGFNANLKRNIRITEMFFLQNKANVIRQALVFFFSIVLLLFFKTQLNKLHLPLNNSEEYFARLITSRVLGIALLFALISTGVIYSYIPSTIREVIIVGFIISCLMVLPRQINKRYMVYIIATVTLYVLHEIGFLFETKLLMYRLILVAESGLSMLIFYKIIKNKDLLFTFLEGIWWQFVWRIKYALYALSISSIVANCLGYLNLATLLTKITAYAILFAIVLSVAQMALLSAFTVLLHTKLSNLSYLVAKNQEMIKKRLNSILQYVLVFLWIRVILNSIGYYDKFIEWIGSFLDINWTIGTSTISLNGIVTFGFIIFVASLLSRAAKQLLTIELFPRINLPRGIPGATSMLVSYFIGGIGIYLAILSTGIDLSKFGLIAGALGVGIGFGLQNVVHNFISGLILAFERPIQVGDTIAVGTLTGIVKSIGIRSSTISTFEGSDVIVPNSNLISNEVINWTLSNQTRRREIPVGVAYGNHPETVLEVLRNVVRQHPDVLPHPLPMCLFDGFGDNSLNFRVLFWAPVDSVLSVQSSLAIAIYDALEEAGMQVPFPQRDIHIKSFERLFDDKNPPK